jgi:Cof subfamily protein (haloacid dehalogenase superfamily)
VSSPRLLVFDLDGTLLDPDHQLRAGVSEALTTLRRFGLETTLATGRCIAAAAPFVRALGLQQPVILFNGAVIASPEGDVCFAARLDRRAAREALVLARGYPLDPQLYLEPEDPFFYAPAHTPAVAAFSRKDGIPPRVVGDLVSRLDAAAIDPLKLLLIGPRPALLALRDRFTETFPEPMCVLSEADFLEILPAGVSKGAALERLCRDLDVPLGEVVAFGDNLNDLEMLRIAGESVAMASAPAEIRDEADHVIDDLSAFLACLGERVARQGGRT